MRILALALDDVGLHDLLLENFFGYLELVIVIDVDQAEVLHGDLGFIFGVVLDARDCEFRRIDALVVGEHGVSCERLLVLPRQLCARVLLLLQLHIFAQAA